MKAIALFNVFPLEFVGMFAIEKEVGIYVCLHLYNISKKKVFTSLN